MDFNCWYCGKSDDELTFSWEFDTPVHVTCVEKEIEKDPDNTEAQIMHRELAT